MTKIKLIEVDSEIGAGTRGASLGIDAMKIASINQGSDYFARHSSLKVKSENHILFEKAEKSFAKNGKTLTKISKRICKSLKKVIKSNSFPIILAGDHSNAAGTIAGIKSAHPKKRLGVIWLDAHADLHSPYTSPSGNVHGMPLAISLGEDNLDRQINKVPKETKKQWEQLKNTSGVAPNIQHSDIVFIGVRDTEEPEDYLIEKHNIKNVTVTEARLKGIDTIISEINDYLSDCDMIYISFDVDSMDCTYVSHGTGTPVPVGFTEWETTQILLKLLKNEKICCFEITEVNPTLDEKCNVMAETAFRILEKATTVIEAK
jgi:arginase